MKKIIIILIGIFLCNYVRGQDIITKKSGDEIKAKVLEITQTEIKYKNADNPDGPSYTISKSDVFMIRYQNGTKDVINPMKTEEAKPAKTEVKSSSSSTSTHVNSKGESSLNLDYGVLSSYTFDETYKWKTWGIGLNYMYSVSKVFNIGFEAYYMSLKSQELLGVYYDYYYLQYYYSSYSYNIDAFAFYVKTQFFWLNNPKFGMYSGLDIGYLTGTATTEGYDPSYSTIELLPGAAQITVVGMKGQLGEHWVTNTELGIGKRGIINVGIGYKF